MDTADVRGLRAFLDDVTRVKLRALQELTYEGPRRDRTFAVFLLQCQAVHQDPRQDGHPCFRITAGRWTPIVAPALCSKEIRECPGLRECQSSYRFFCVC